MPPWEHVRDRIAAEHTSEGIPMEAHLSGRHRDTVEKIFSHPPNHNIAWREVVSLLEAIGTVSHEHNGKLKVSLGPETEVLGAPHGKDVDVQVVVDLRRMLRQAGFSPDGSPAIADQSARDHGDGQWGEPT
jgi:hypothetical protein